MIISIQSDICSYSYCDNYVAIPKNTHSTFVYVRDIVIDNRGRLAPSIQSSVNDDL